MLIPLNNLFRLHFSATSPAPQHTHPQVYVLAFQMYLLGLLHCIRKPSQRPTTTSSYGLSHPTPSPPSRERKTHFSSCHVGWQFSLALPGKYMRRRFSPPQQLYLPKGESLFINALGHAYTSAGRRSLERGHWIGVTHIWPSWLSCS